MPYAKNEDVKIYYEVYGEGTPIILAHGFINDINYWHSNNYVTSLMKDYQVIIFDARAHGKSDKPHETEAYDSQHMVADVVAILDDLDISRAHYWGYSMGGYIGFCMAKEFPQRLHSFIAGGTNPLFDPPKEDHPNPFLDLLKRGIQEGADAVIAAMKAGGGIVTPQYEQRLREADFAALVAFRDNNQRPNFKGVLSEIQVPCLLYAGDQDKGAHPAAPQVIEEMPNARYFSLEGLNHISASSATDLIIPQVLSFLSEIQA